MPRNKTTIENILTHDKGSSDAQFRHLEKQVATLTEALAQTRAAKFKIPTQRARSSKRGAFVRFFLPDTHGACVDEICLSAILADLEYLQPREIFLMGDHLDCKGGFLAPHQPPTFIEEIETNFADDVSAANEMIDAVQTAAPKAAIKYLEGNHEERIERWILKQTSRIPGDAVFLRNLCGPEAVLHLQKRNIPYISKARTYDDCPVQGTVKAGRCYVTHGTSHGRNAAAQMLARFAGPVVFGHVHKLLSCTDRTVAGGTIGAWSVGCASQLQPLWRHGSPTDWQHGYGFQVVQPDGEFTHLNVPVVAGRTLLKTLGQLLT